MVPELDQQFSNITLRKEKGISDIKEELKALRKKILSLDFEHSMCVHDPQNSLQYLEVVCKVREQSEKLGSLEYPSGETKEQNELAVYAEDLFDMSMARLEEEFVYLLTRYKQPLEQEHVSFRSTEDGSMEDLSVSSFSEEQNDSHASQNDTSGGSEDFVVDLIEAGALSAVKSIANFMFLCSYDMECCQAYINARKDAMEEYLCSLRLGKFSVEELMSINWKSLSSLISRWNRAMRVFVRVYLASERRLGNHVFGELSGPTTDICFNEISSSSVMQILNFYESIAIGPPKPEKLFRLLDLYEVLADLLPEIEFFFPARCDDTEMILTEYHEVLLQLGESVMRTFAEFKLAIQSYTSSSAMARGEVHPLTRYVMNYIRTLSAYSKTLDSLLKNTDQRDPYFAAEVHPMASSGPHFTLTALHLQSVTALLEANLEDGSTLYKDDALKNIFMTNNVSYMVEKVKNSDLKGFLGDDWIRVHNTKFRQHERSYERASWNHVLSFLSDEGLSNAGYAASRKVIKEKFKCFNQSFEDVYRVQTAWSVPNSQLRDDVRISISLKVIQAYRMFMGRYASRLHGTKNMDRYIKYRPEDLERLLLDLFEGTHKSL